MSYPYGGGGYPGQGPPAGYPAAPGYPQPGGAPGYPQPGGYGQQTVRNILYICTGQT